MSLQVDNVPLHADLSLARWDPWTDVYTWKNPDNYANTHWYRFQEAVKQHQSDTLAILMESNLKGINCRNFNVDHPFVPES